MFGNIVEGGGGGCGDVGAHTRLMMPDQHTHTRAKKPAAKHERCCEILYSNTVWLLVKRSARAQHTCRTRCCQLQTNDPTERANKMGKVSAGRTLARRQPGTGTTFILFRALSQVAGELNRGRTKKNFRRVRVSQINALAHTQMQHKNPLSKAQRRMSDRISCAHPHSHTHMLRIQCCADANSS